jgi:hypothetical protein
MMQLFRLAIYVNASSDGLQAANRGKEPSLPRTEKKRWTRGLQLLEEARSLGQELPLVFAHYAELTFWAVAREITVNEETTDYRFVNLLPIRGFRRSDLMVDSTASPLPDNFIRSYAVVRTPSFLSGATEDTEGESGVEELIGLEGELKRRMITHRHREHSLRKAKIEAALHTGGGRLVCQVPGCGFDFRRTYGQLGDGYAHVHHIRPLAEYDGTGNTCLDDLAVVCANCHAMIHRGGECRPLTELIQMGKMENQPNQKNFADREERGGKF